MLRRNFLRFLGVAGGAVATAGYAVARAVASPIDTIVDAAFAPTARLNGIFLTPSHRKLWSADLWKAASEDFFLGHKKFVGDENAVVQRVTSLDSAAPGRVLFDLNLGDTPC